MKVTAEVAAECAQRTMKTIISRYRNITVIALASCLLGFFGLAMAQQRAAVEVAIGSADLGGVVTSPNGPEAGVWVIAETTDLPTKFAKMVVTDDRGRYVIPRSSEGATTTCGCAATGWSIRPR